MDTLVKRSVIWGLIFNICPKHMYLQVQGHLLERYGFTPKAELSVRWASGDLWHLHFDDAVAFVRVLKENDFKYQINQYQRDEFFEEHLIDRLRHRS